MAKSNLTIVKEIRKMTEKVESKNAKSVLKTVRYKINKQLKK